MRNTPSKTGPNCLRAILITVSIVSKGQFCCQSEHDFYQRRRNDKRAREADRFERAFCRLLDSLCDVMNIPSGNILHILSALRQLCEGAFCLVKIPVLILEVQYLSIIAK